MKKRMHPFKGEGAISTLRSAVKVLVIPANEESIVARETVAVVKRNRDQGSEIRDQSLVTG